jgi:hypothetical protein
LDRWENNFVKEVPRWMSVARWKIESGAVSTRFIWSLAVNVEVTRMFGCKLRYLLAVPLEDGIVDFSRVGAIQVLPDAL